MEALVKFASGPGNVALQPMPEPIPGHGQVLLEVQCCGICGTDLHVYHDTFKNYPPVILGHEFVGTVVEKGPGVPESIQYGDQFAVLGATAVTCGHCRYCRMGEFMFCQQRRGMGHGVHGAFARFAVARPDQLFRVAAQVPAEEAALVEPLAAAVHAVCDIARFGLGDVALVSGPGPIGLLCLKLLLRQGIHTIVVGTSADGIRLAKAREMGAALTLEADRDDVQEALREATRGEGIDIAFEVAGAEASVRTCLNSLRPLGKYVQVGHFGKDLLVPWDHVAFKQLDIKGSVGYTRDTWRRTLQIMGQGLNVGDLISHDLPLAAWKKGFELCENKQAIKVLLRP